jgi:hypothetical protein
MKFTDSQRLLQDDRSGLSEALRSINPSLCFVIGLIVCASLAYYFPLILIALTGIWVNNLTMMLQFMVFVAILIITNCIGNRLRRIFLANAVMVGLAISYEAWYYAHGFNWSELSRNWMVFFLPVAAFLLNAWLFLRFKAAAGLK